MLEFDKKIIHLESVGSTNNYAMDLIKNGMARHGNAVTTRIQTEGKGRRGKRWSSTPEENILLSIMAEMSWQPISHQFPLSVAVSLACLDFLHEYVDEGVTIKWPNDIFYNDSKAAGILIENLISGTKWQWSVIGIGLNVNQTDFGEVQKSVTSMKAILRQDFSVIALTAQLYEKVLQRIKLIADGHFRPFLKEYNQKLYGKNQRAFFTKGTFTFEAVILKVNEDGQLLLEVDGREQLFSFDEITFAGLSSR